MIRVLIACPLSVILVITRRRQWAALTSAVFMVCCVVPTVSLGRAVVNDDDRASVTASDHAVTRYDTRA